VRCQHNPEAEYDSEWLSEALYSAAIGSALGGIGGVGDVALDRAVSREQNTVNPQETAKVGEVFQTQEQEAEKRPQIPAPAPLQDTSEGVYTSEEKRAAEALTGKKNTASTNKGEAAEVIKVLSDSIPALKAEPIVAKTSSQAFREVPGDTMAEKARKLFEGIKGIVARPGFGDVEINGRSVKDDLSHGVGPAKAATIVAVPQVIQRGKQVDYQENWKGRGYDGYAFAAPVEMDGETVYVAAVVKKTSKNRFYLHEVVDSNGNIIKIDDIESANPTSLAANGDAGTQSPSSTSGFTIAHPADSVNTAVRRQDNTADEIARRTAQLRSDIQAGAQKTLGKEGYRAFEADFRNTPESDPIETYQQLTRAYNEGVANRRSTDSTLPAARYNAMFEAGRKDAEASLQAQTKKAGAAVVHNGGIDYADAVTQQYMAASVDKKTAKVIDRTAKALGVRVRFADSVADGAANAQIENGVVTIEKGNPNPVRFLFGHEITHRMQELAPAEYGRLREAVTAGGWADAGIKDIQRRYAEHGMSIDSEAALDEAVADYVGKLLEDNGELERFIARSQGDRTLLQKLRDAFRDLAAKLRNSEHYQQAKRVEQRLTEAMKASMRQVGSAGQAQKNTTQEGGVRYSIKEIDNRLMPEINTKNDTRKFDAAEAYLTTLINSEKPFSTILYDAQPVYVGKDLPSEYRSSEYTKTMRSALRNVKMQAATNLDEMLLLASNGSWQENKKTKHETDAKNGWYRYDTEFAVPVMDHQKLSHHTIYSATLLIRNDADGKSYLYDLIDLKEKKKVNSSAPSQSGVFELDPSSEVNVAQQDEIVKGEPVGSAKLSLKDSATLAQEIARIQKEGIAGKRSDADIQADIRAVVDEAYRGFIGEYINGLLEMLPEVVRNAEYVGSGEYVQHSGKVRPVIRYDYFETPVDVDRGSYIAKFDVEVLPGANNYRTHQIVNIDLISPEASLAGP